MTSSAPSASARAMPHSGSAIRSSRFVTTIAEQRTERSTASTRSTMPCPMSAIPSPSYVATIVSAAASEAHAVPSSIALVECGSGNTCRTKKSANSG